MAAIDYVRRTVDFLAFQGAFTVNQFFPVTADLLDAQGVSYVTTGAEKLAQRFLVILLTIKGTMLYQPLLGTTFLQQAQLGAWRTSADVLLSFNASRIDFTRQLLAAQLAADPLDEQFVSVDVTQITLTGTAVTLSLTLTTAAGTSFNFIAPIAAAI